MLNKHHDLCPIRLVLLIPMQKSFHPYLNLLGKQLTELNSREQIRHAEEMKTSGFVRPRVSDESVY